MARGRFLNASIAVDVALNSLSLEGHWLYLMTIPHLDRDGLIIADMYVFFGKVCPRRPELIPRMDELIGEWVKAGLAIVYPTHDGKVAYFYGFHKNQQGMHYAREGASTLDVPPGYVRTDSGIEEVQEEIPHETEQAMADEKQSPDQLPTNSGLTPDEVPLKFNINVNEKGESARADTRVSAPRRTPPPQSTRKELTQRRATALVGDYAGCDPRLLTALTNHVKRIYGYDMLIDSPGDDKLEDKMRREAYRIWKTGFTDEESMQVLESSWQQKAAGFKIKSPQGDQLYELAINLQSRVGDVATPVNGFHKSQKEVTRLEGEDW